MKRFIYNYIVYNYMVTTIQVQQQTLELLKKLKEETRARSYDEAITKIVVAGTKTESLYGFLGKRSRKWILKDLRDKSDRF